MGSLGSWRPPYKAPEGYQMSLVERLGMTSHGAKATTSSPNLAAQQEDP